MLDLTNKALPHTVSVDGRAFNIKTDFRVWLRFEKDLQEHSIKQEEFDVSYVFEGEMPKRIDVQLLVDFERPPRELPRRIGPPNQNITLDFEIDADLIVAAFQQQYGIDLTSVDMHWYRFLALIQGISDETMLGKVMGYRNYEKSTSKKDVREELKRAWEIRPKMTSEEQEEMDEFNSYFA